MDLMEVSEGTVPVGSSELYYREVGEGQPIVVLHGATAYFNHNYLLPDMDRLADHSFRLVYYDQRGRGRSARGVEPETVSIESEVDDLESLRKHLRSDSLALLGHSWGGLLAMEYATRHPDRVSHLVLMNTAPASRNDWLLTERNFVDTKALEETPAFRERDPDAVAEYQRFFFSSALRRPEHLGRLIENMKRGSSREDILRAERIGDRLWKETYLSEGYDLLPRLRELAVPTLVIHGDYDFVPVACAARIAQAMPGARFVLLRDTGHFAYIESADDVRREVSDFFGSQPS
jgi:proline iminopeptidase